MIDTAVQTIQQVAAYFNACFQADNREHSLWDLFSDKNEFLQVVSEDQYTELSRIGHCQLNWDYSFKMEKNIAIYRREKMLLFGHYFVFGQLPISGGLSKKLAKICAPLLFTELSISKERQGYVGRIDPSMYRWNSQLLSLISTGNDVEAKLSAALDGAGVIDTERLISLLRTVVDDSFKVQVLDPIEHMTQLKKVKATRHQSTLSIANGGCFVFTKRSTASRGIIDELNVMAKSQQHSQANKRLLCQIGKEKWFTNSHNISHVPGLLSQAQQQALNNAALKDISVVVGPPGTGKSYTIACIILERFMQGESVLLVTQNESAVDVVQQKLTEYLGISANAIIRSGSKHYHQDLKRKLADILGGLRASPIKGRHSIQLNRLLKSIHKAERRFVQEASSAVKDGLFLNELDNGNLSNHWFNRIKKWFIENRINKHTPLYQQLSQIHNMHKIRESVLAELISSRYMHTLHHLLKNSRKHLVKFDSALRARTSSKQESRFLDIDYELLLKALPIWLSSLSGLHRSLPLRADLFDLVIIDEATQCNIASCLPALHRAKRAMVVGDPKQLRHLSFLSRNKQQQLQEKFQLDDSVLDLNYRDHSMIDFVLAQVQSQEAVVMLDEHYRSMPEIIQFSNERFYRNQLRIMTAKPTTAQKSAVRVIHVSDGRRRRGVNANEIKELFKKLNQILAFQKQLPQQHQQSIGVLSFFSDQAETIQKLLLKHYDIHTLMQHNIRSATPYGFQGEERDIMLISCGVGLETSGNVYRYLNRSDVFNVAVTRARDLQYLFVSSQIEDMPHNNLLREYLIHVSQYKVAKTHHMTKLDAQLKLLCEQLHEQGLRTIHHYVVAGVPMDLLVVYKDQVLAVDLIGFPGIYQDVLRIEQYHIFSRADLAIFPLSLGRWQNNPAAVVSVIKAALKDLYQQSIHNISVTHRTQRWKKISPIDASLAGRVRNSEHQLIANNHQKAIKQLNELIETYCELNFSLSEKLNPGELTWLRYQHSFTQIIKSCLQRFDQMSPPVDGHEHNQAIQLLAENQKALEKLQETKNHLKQLMSQDQKQGKDIDDVWTELDDLNKKIFQFNDMDDF